MNKLDLFFMALFFYSLGGLSAFAVINYCVKNKKA
jgi:hypothetical protein